MADRVDPFALVFGALADERFPGLAESLHGAGRDEADRDAFVLSRPVIELLQDLVPESHEDGQVTEFVATLHHAYLYWRAGCPQVEFDRAQAARLLSPAGGAASAPDRPPRHPSAYYRFPERLVWAQLTPEAPHEPLDGFFARPSGTGIIRVLGVFGVHTARPGFGVAEAMGPRPRSLTRPDGSPSFSPVLPGGDAAGLHSLVGTDELLELGSRSVSEAG